MDHDVEGGHPMKLAPLSLALTLVLLTWCAASAVASPLRSTRETTSQGFCGVARGVARDIVNSTAISNGRVMPANVKTAYARIAAAEPALLASASPPIKADLRPVFGFVNLLIVDLKKANWNAGGLASYARTLIARARTIQAPLHSLEVYFHTTCKLNV
jgi:hypothetical protein